MSDFIFKFGRYRGESIVDTPSGYLQWIQEHFDEDDPKNKQLFEAIEEELATRDRSDSHFYTWENP